MISDLDRMKVFENAATAFNPKYRHRWELNVWKSVWFIIYFVLQFNIIFHLRAYKIFIYFDLSVEGPFQRKSGEGKKFKKKFK